MKYDEFLELIKVRRSIRRLRSDPVPDEYIENILETVRIVHYERFDESKTLKLDEIIVRAVALKERLSA